MPIDPWKTRIRRNLERVPAEKGAICKDHQARSFDQGAHQIFRDELARGYVLHQRGGDKPDWTIRDWSSLLESGVGLIVPWSSQLYDLDRRCWDDLEIAEKEVAWAYSQLKKRKAVDLQNVVIAGFSQGAALAIYLALKRVFPCKGFIAVAPSDWVVREAQRAVERDQPSPAFTSFIQNTNAQGIRGSIFIGAKDPFLTKMGFLKDQMARRGLESKYSLEPELGARVSSTF